MHYHQLNRLIGNIDLHLLDEILKGRFNPQMRILDAGCGEGRNLQYFLAQGYSVFGVDKEPMAIKMLRMQAREMPEKNFVVSAIEDRPFSTGFFGAILCVNVLQHAVDTHHFDQILEALVDMLASGGVLFIRLETEFLMKHLHRPVPARVDKTLTNNVIIPWMERFALRSLAPVKQEIVDNSIDLLTLVAQKIR